MTLDAFNKNYIYKSDTDKFGVRLDVWEVISPDKDGKYYGDCESYMLTLKSLVREFRNIELYYCKINGVGHCIGIRDGKVIDCNCQNLIPIDKYIARYNATDIKRYGKAIVTIKKLVGWLVNLLRR